MASNGADIRSTLKGVTDARYDGKILQYRGIQYATIKERFASPKLNVNWQKKTDFTKFGPRCPGPHVDVRGGMQVPKELPEWEAEKEDELQCDNLTVTCPSDAAASKLPVLIWIYGGSQMIAFGSAGQRLGDACPLVAQSIEMKKPIILVSIHHRLNIFGFGGREGELNLDLQDQRAAIEWTKAYISSFGGDPDNITLGGESAGAIYAHALVASGADVARAILDSGSLFARPPQSDKRCLGLLGLIEGDLQLMQVEKGNENPGESPESVIEGASPATLVQALKDLKITSKWMWEQVSLDGWQQNDKVFKKLKGLMIGDCEWEGAIYGLPVNALTGASILKALEAVSPEHGKRIADAYGVDNSNAELSRMAAFQFIGDSKFNYPSWEITQAVNKAGGKAYRYIFDQVNPFAQKLPYKIAHHGVDLFAIFGGYDEHVGPEMQAVGKTLRTNWINFINGEEPWSADKVFAYGPDGKTGELSQDEAAPRRRIKQFELLREVGLEVYSEMWLAILSAGNTALADE